MTELARVIPALVAAHGVSVAYVDRQTGERYEYRAAERVHAASTMKVAVLLAALQVADLDEPLLVENRFASRADGSPFEVDPHDDSDPWPYEQLGRKVPLRKLLERMIVRSSNLATNLVMRRVPAKTVQSYCERVGAGDMHVLRGVEDGKAHRQGLDNTTTAHALAALMEAALDAPAAVELLAKQELNEGIPAALPPGTRVAHKTGSIERIYHDAAIVFPPGRKPYVLVVLTHGFAKEADAVAAVHEVARAVHQHALDAAR